MIGDEDPRAMRKARKRKRCPECGVKGCRRACLELERDPEAFGEAAPLGLGILDEPWAEDE